MPVISLFCLQLVLFLSYQIRADSSDSQMSDSQLPHGMTGMSLRLVFLHDIISHYLLIHTVLTSQTH